MIPEEPLHTTIRKKLQSVDGDRVAGYERNYGALIGLPELLKNFSRLDLVHHLIQWSYDFPNATNLLLLAVARCQDPSVYNHVANALVSSLPTWGEDRDCSIGAGEVLSMAFHQFHGYTRDFVADRYEVYKTHNLREGVDYHALGTLSDDEKWDEHTPLPKPDINQTNVSCVRKAFPAENWTKHGMNRPSGAWLTFSF